MLTSLLAAAGYRAGRLRLIFRLPQRLQHLYPDELAYVELFTPFGHSLSPIHQLHTTSHAHSEGHRLSAVIPIDHIALGCHLAPRFRWLDPDIVLNYHADLLDEGRRFFFNHYFNYYTVPTRTSHPADPYSGQPGVGIGVVRNLYEEMRLKEESLNLQ